MRTFADREMPIKVRRLGPHSPVCECRSVSQPRRTQVSCWLDQDGRPGTSLLPGGFLPLGTQETLADRGRSGRWVQGDSC
jgi:hypothetical protein